MVFSRSSLEMFGPTTQDLARVYQDVGRVGIGEARTLGAADHVHVQVGHDLGEIEEWDIR